MDEQGEAGEAPVGGPAHDSPSALADEEAAAEASPPVPARAGPGDETAESAALVSPAEGEEEDRGEADLHARHGPDRGRLSYFFVLHLFS
eukprot:8805329-Pyramimonas_sp.AAC.1